MVAIEKLKKHIAQKYRNGNVTAFAEHAGLKPSTVFKWIERESVPELKNILKIQEATDGEISVKDWE